MEGRTFGQSEPVWIPTRVQRIASGCAAVGGLAAVVILSPVGGGEVQAPVPALLSLIVIASIAFLALAVWQGGLTLAAIPLRAGVLAMFYGVYLAYAVYVPYPDGGYVAVYTLIGSLLILWGLLALLVGIASIAFAIGLGRGSETKSVLTPVLE